ALVVCGRGEAEARAGPAGGAEAAAQVCGQWPRRPSARYH
ncbi:unnamed protein product, partial [marine sediment metagenome]